MSKLRPNAGLFAAILLVIVLLPVGYMGAYYAMVERVVITHGIPFEASYRFGGGAAEHFFRPAHWIDKKLRFRYWEETDLVG